MYNNYEEYMRSVLGYNMPNNTYKEAENYYYEPIRVNPNMQELSRMYPEIYGIVYPIVQKVCSRTNLLGMTEEQMNRMVDEVYNVIEPGDDIVENRENLKNGDVRNPRAKETRRPPARNNYLLKDLIRILIIRELLSGGGHNFMPGGGMPPRPGPGGQMGPMPQVLRPGNTRMF